MKRSRVKPKRSEPRRRLAPRWTAEEWADANRKITARSGGGRCECCGKWAQPWDPIERHHRMKRDAGGDRLANVIFLLRSCHQRWTEHPEHATRRGIIVSQFCRNLEAVPLLHRGAEWVVLDDDGHLTALPGEQDPLRPRDTPDGLVVSEPESTVGTTEPGPPGQDRGATS